jgi:hypothetical protein
MGITGGSRAGSGPQQLVQAKALLSFGHYLASGLCPYCTTSTTTTISTVLFQRLQKARSCQPCSAPVTVAFYEPAVTPLLRSVTCVCPLTHCRIRARMCLLLRLDRCRLVVLLLRLGRLPPPLPPPRPWPAAVTLRLLVATK